MIYPFEKDEQGQLKNRWVNARRLADRSIDELIGMCKGMLSDGATNEDEVNFLKLWLEANQEYINQWPANILSARLCEILADGIIDKKEKDDLFILLNDITGGTKTFYEELKNNATLLPFCKPAPAITFKARQFCLTGQFFYGTRNRCESEIQQRGGTTQKQPSQKTDYLIIGHLGSTDWMHTSFGRKIESAVELKGKGFPISIVSEEHWVKFL